MSVAQSFAQKFRFNKEFTGAGVIGPDSLDIILSKNLRVVVENVAGGNTILVKGRIFNATAWATLATITGASAGTTIDTSVVDQIQFECTVYAASGSPRLIASGFPQA